MDKVLFDKVRQDHPGLRFRRGVKFLFRPPRTIVLGPEEPGDDLIFMHELGHALSGHRDFRTNIERMRCECEAWEKARELCGKYGVTFDEDFAETELESYRNWLDKKSRCPICGLTRFQTPDGAFHCPKCDM